MATLAELLRSALTTRLDPAACEWFDASVAAAARGGSIASACSMAPRRIGRAALALTDHERRDLASAAPGVVFDRWTLVDAARAVLFVTLGEAVPGDAFAAAASEWYELGDTSEQESWLRLLPLLPRPERFVTLAVDACRTNIVPLFESIACDNPYPARYFPMAQFNQLVMKALFLGVALARIVGLPAQRNDELARMARDFADERRAAGRPTPPDLHLAFTDPRSAESLR